MLVLHLNRYGNAREATYRLGHRIGFTTTVHLRPGTEPYILTGVLLHDGQSLNSGHYTALTHCVATGRLFFSDDANMPKLLDEARMQEMEKKAYMLVYSLESSTIEAASLLQRLRLPDARVTPVKCD